ncbi:MAG: UDP-N-acetylmuramoyl-tripeptide--D-alanyl-D-alanine ligase [Candidatus Saccharibacteria bacterium]
MLKMYVRQKLESYVKKYFKKHPEVKLVAVAGSVGKTTTKLAIATVLAEKYRVRMQNGNHNTHISSPLAILGIDFPENVKGIRAWFEVFRAAKIRISQPTDVDVIIQELGTDKIGEIPHFGKYLKPDIGIVTAVAPEHMEFFGNLDNVAREELSVANFSKLALINRDDIDGKYAEDLTNAGIDTYGTSAPAEYYFINDDFSVKDGYKGKFFALELKKPLDVQIKVFGEHNIRPAVVAGAVALKLGLNDDEIARGFSKIVPVPGRMNVLRGLREITIIDDTYNSSPLAVQCALRALYGLSVPQRIAVLGSMNEMGDSSVIEHQAVGALCDPAQLAWVVTVGDDANEYIAESAKSKGCQVKTCKNAIEAGAFVNRVAEEGAAVLFKGSQGGVFLEEAVKIILHATEEESQLVRQSAKWMQIKNDFFQK